MSNAFDWPLFALCDDIRSELRGLIKKGKKFVIATLVEAEGSAPRGTGSQMLISEDRDVFGYVSGGCIESNLCEMGIDAIKNNKSSKVTFGYGSPYIDIRLLCGKKIEVAIDVINPEEEALLNLLEYEKQRKPSFWISDIVENRHLCITSFGDKRIPEELREVIKLRDTGSKNNYYWKKYNPRLRLVVNGSNPVTMAVLLIARKMGWEIIFNREHGSELPSVLGVDFYRKTSGAELFDEFKLDEMTAVVSLTHDLEADHDILKYALPSKAFYVGVLGSRKHLPRREDLMNRDNLSPESIIKLKAPIGLDIKAATANEIAIAIIGDIIKHHAVIRS
ncbi:MAG: XdhC family protein [Alphaproteobacteria bacterium]